VIALRAIESPALWWQLSRGRAVIQGKFSPDRALLIAEENASTDWLSGVPGFVAFALLGSTGLMLLRLLATFLIGFALVRRATPAAAELAWIVAWLALITAQAALDPGPAQITLLGLAGIGLLGTHPVADFSWTTRALAGFLFWLAVGCGLDLVWATLVFLITKITEDPDDHEKSAKNSHLGIAAALLGLGCLTPRGPWAWSDSLGRLWPPLLASPAELVETPFRPLRHFLLEPEVWTWFLLMGIGFLVLSRRKVGLKIWSVWLLLLALASISRTNLAPAALASAILLLSPRVLGPAETFAAPPRLRGLVAILLGLAALVHALGVFDPADRGLSWGLSPRLDFRLLQPISERMPTEGSVLAANARAAGMWCWLNPQGPRVWDEPERALLGGRLRSEARFWSDLRTGFRDAQPRADGTQGGWWLTLQARKTALLIVPAEETTLIRALEPTSWKPLLLDAPCLAYGWAGLPAWQPTIVDVLQQRWVVERGPWQFTAPRDSTWIWEPLGDLRGRPSREPILRQARALRAMRLPLAALRVLGPFLSQADKGPLRDEFLACQRDLATEEQLLAGTVSPLRAALLAPNNSWQTFSPWILEDNISPTKIADWERMLGTAALAHMRSGQPAAAAELWSRAGPETCHARAWAALESGDVRDARDSAAELVARWPGHRLAILARELLESLEHEASLVTARPGPAGP